MCGIAGIISQRGSVAPQSIERMTGAVRHRGPDDEGHVYFRDDAMTPVAFGGDDTPPECFASSLPYAPAHRTGASGPTDAAVAFGHRRLSIIDISARGHQPMCTRDAQFWIVFNGEIYNYVELREDLRREGYSFDTQSDTEVILSAYRAWGRACLNRFNGMFAFLLLDRRKGKVLAVRDRFGIKPLYYWVSPMGDVAFASEIKQFAVLDGWAAKLNPQRVYDYLTWGLTDHSRETLFSGVFQVRPGELLEIGVPGARSNGDAVIPTEPAVPTRWYNLSPRPFTGSFEDAAAEFHDIFTQSIRVRLRADVPVGSCLSGGIDSSSIVCTMDRLLPSAQPSLQRTFSACARVPRYDERFFIDEVVRSARVGAHYVYPSLPDLFTDLDCITHHQDEPFGSTSIFAQWCVFRLARENGVTVMLDGQGADEQLAGYHSFFGPRLAGLFKNRQFARLGAEVRAIKRVHGLREVAALKAMLGMLIPTALRPLARGIGSRTSVSPAWLDAQRLGADPEDPYARRGAVTDSVQAFSHAQLTSTNLQMLLHWEDRDSMAHSLEARLPFLDFNVVEFTLGLPEEYKLKMGMTKRVLREAMRGIIPESIRSRTDKLGFVTPEEVWVREGDPAKFRELVRDAISVSDGVLRPSLLLTFDRIVAGREPFSFIPWRAISFASWLRCFSPVV